MGNSAAKYKVIGIAPNRVCETSMRGAPQDSRLCEWGKLRDVQFVIRYFPSKRGWAVLDIRAAIQIRLATRGVSVWKGCGRHSTYFPNEDAAVMFAMHHLDVEVPQ